MTRDGGEGFARFGLVRDLVSRRSSLAELVHQASRRFPLLWDAAVRVARGNSERRYKRWIAAYDTFALPDVGPLSDARRRFSIVITDSRVAPVDHLHGCEVTVVAAADAGKWNAALARSTAEYCVVLDPLVELRPHTLPFFAQAIDEAPNAVLVYADEDVIDGDGRRSRHDFKPEWNEALFRSQNYLGGVVCFSRARALEVGGCERELDGDCLWGLLMKLTADAPAGSIRHLPYVLSHRRPHPPMNIDRHRVATAITQRLRRGGDEADTEPVGDAGYLVRYRLKTSPRITIIVPSRADPGVLGPCVDGIFHRTSYANFELLVVANGVPENAVDSTELLRTVGEDPRADVLFADEGPYNFSALNNRAAQRAAGDFLCFLNDDTEVIENGWLEALVGEGCRRGVAAVGALLLYPNDRIQHAGCILGAGGIAAHAYHGRPRGSAGYHGRALVAQDVSAVTAACVLVRRAEFFAVGGFDEELPVAYNDVDLCLRLRARGQRIVWTPAAKLRHKEGASLKRHYSGATRSEWARGSDLMRQRWSEHLLADPYYNQNLSLDPLLLWEPAFPPRVTPAVAAG